MTIVDEMLVTEALAHDLVVLELRARAAEAAGDLGRADGVWAQREEVRHRRSLLLRQRWAHRAELWWNDAHRR